MAQKLPPEALARWLLERLTTNLLAARGPGLQMIKLEAVEGIRSPVDSAATGSFRARSWRSSRAR